MNKTEFIKAVADKAGISIKDAGAAYDAAIATITAAIKGGDKVALVGFGTFELKAKAARTGINPATGKPVAIKACKAPALKFGKAFKDSFN